MVKRSRTIKGETVVKLLRRIAVNVGWSIRARTGEAMVEFALVAPLFFVLMFGVMDFGRLFFTQETLQYAVREAGRYAVTGQHQTDKSGSSASRVQSIKNIINQYSLGMNISNISITSGGVTNYAGGPRQTVVVSVTDNLKLITPMIGRFFPNNTYSFTVSTSFMNEPFDPGQTY
jgi:Flp pilus assembly protein TadG